MDYREYVRALDEAERDFAEAVEAFGIPFEKVEGSPRALRAQTAAGCGCRCENGDASLWRNWISPACLACRTGEQTATFFVDLRCTRHCYFCFNPNQDHYRYFLSHKRNIVAELEQAHAAGARFRCLAVTGGEPMLHRDHVCAFLRRAQELYPGVHTRLYTCGDLLDEEGLRLLAESGLSEIRFSVKPCGSDDARVGGTDGLRAADADVRDASDSVAGDCGAEGCGAKGGCGAGGQGAVFALVEKTVSLIPDVVIEVPVIPGSLAEMKDLLLRADAVGVRGVNLLEFCFPLCNAEEFRRRGFRLRRHPYNHLYNYWYGGGVPVAGSESEALELVRFAECEGLGLGVHYCSSDNKNTGQIFQQNKVFTEDASLRERYPWLQVDEGDRFLKCAKAFGDDARRVRAWIAAEERSVGLGGSGATHGRLVGRCHFDAAVPSVSFPLSWAEKVRAGCPGVTVGESANVFEQQQDGSLYLREVSVRAV